jgi:hypothetical protein
MSCSLLLKPTFIDCAHYGVSKQTIHSAALKGMASDCCLSRVFDQVRKEINEESSVGLIASNK